MRELREGRKLDMINLNLPMGSKGLLRLRVKALRDYEQKIRSDAYLNIYISEWLTEAASKCSHLTSGLFFP